MKIVVTALLSLALLPGQQPLPTPTPTPPKVAPKVEKAEPKPAADKPRQPEAPQQPEPKQPVETPKDPVKDPAQESPGQPREGDPAPVIPQGSDPADLAAMRSAEAMLAAERRLAQLLKEGKIAGLDKVVTFDELTAWVYEDGLKGMPKKLKDLNGKKVLMSGFMLPIDEVQNIKEFLLVQSLWSCCYGQPPDINGIVRVVMPKGKTTDYFFDPLKVIGTFKVEATTIDGYCVDIYQIEVESLEALK
jgi:hypothetical protein